ncbi:hypothetical protein C5167_044599 [Papaver somniferum]|uniref:Protein kinase domain-containing protein n=1 Tax=Papaver somniferum TaxID=3469 RepID=A0A4Y7L901_PAPSO|nr:hypothetical protein C5167_044599 [Papaver somniferum]
MTLNYIFNYSYVSNENESYFTYDMYDSSIISRFVMDISGQIKQFTWSNTTERWNLFWSQPKELCDVYGICGTFGNCNQDTLTCECLPGFVRRSPTDQNFQVPTGGCGKNITNLECVPINRLKDSTDGCTRNKSLQCRSKDFFLPIAASNFPDNSQSQNFNSMEDCKSACESTCSCNGYAYTDSGCMLWDGNLLNVKQKLNVSAGNLYLKQQSEISSSAPTSSPIPITEVRKRRAIIWKIIIPVFTLVAIIMGAFGYIYLFKRDKANKKGKLKELQSVLADLLKSKATYNNTSNTNMLDDVKSEEETQELQIFNLTCLATATNNFCLKNKLGEGGFGPVYKGILQNAHEIAVKRLSKNSGQGIEEFKNEVVLISKLQHRNLVKLLGCCVEGKENMLVYEFMPNKSLDAFLFDPRRKAQLNWEKRFNIIGGIARGLLYLHRDSRLRVIHRDLKVGNILLDEDMTPKISDFGMARRFSGNQTIANTSRVVGTFGYMSREYIMGGTFSEKSDVFSFGVLILEIVSGKKNNSFYDPEQPLNLLLHTWCRYHNLYGHMEDD